MKYEAGRSFLRSLAGMLNIFGTLYVYRFPFLCVSSKRVVTSLRCEAIYLFARILCYYCLLSHILPNNEIVCLFMKILSVDGLLDDEPRAFTLIKYSHLQAQNVQLYTGLVKSS